MVQKPYMRMSLRVAGRERQMSDCSNSRCEPYRRVDVRIVFTNKKEHDYHLPLDLVNREIDYFDVDGEIYSRQEKRTHQESWEWLND